MDFNNSFPLPAGQFVNEDHKKDLIVLHHTVGGSAKSTIDYWKSDSPRIGTAFVVERDGTVYRTFPEEKWAFHLGIKGIGNDIDRRSIGIEIASEGGLIERNGKFYCFDKVMSRTEFHGEIYTHEKIWRGYKYFAQYTEQQLVSTFELINYLCAKFNIPKTLPQALNTFDVNNYNHVGIVSHANVRADKSDVHPGFPFDRI